MMREFDTEAIRLIRIFEQITGSVVRDCIADKEVYYLLESGPLSTRNLRRVQQILKRRVRVFKHDPDPEKFIRNLIPKASEVEINGKLAFVRIDEEDRGKIIGKGGANIKKIRALLSRNSELRKLILK